MQREKKVQGYGKKRYWKANVGDRTFKPQFLDSAPPVLETR